MTTRTSSAIAAIFGRGGEEGRHRGRRALVDVGRPHVERHRGDLEGEAGEHEDEAEDEADRAWPLRAPRRSPAKDECAGEAVDQRRAVEEHAGGERAEHEILQAGLGRPGVVAMDGGDDVERERLQLEPEIEAIRSLAEIIISMPSVDEQDAGRELELLDDLAAAEAKRHEDGGGEPISAAPS